jgi:hypothetical protein
MIHPIQLDWNVALLRAGEQKNALTLLTLSKENVFKRLFDLHKRSGSRRDKNGQKEHREVAQQKRKIDNGSVTRYSTGCAKPGDVSYIAAHALKHVLTQ